MIRKEWGGREGGRSDWQDLVKGEETGGRRHERERRYWRWRRLWGGR